MHQAFNLQNLYVILTHRTHDKYQGVYHLNGKLYQIAVKGDTFNAVRDKLRADTANHEGEDVNEVLHLTEEWVIHYPVDYVKDIFRVTSGNRVTPNYSGQGTYIAPSDGYTEQEILSMADQDFPLTIGAKHRFKDNAEMLEAFHSELSNSVLSDQLLVKIQAVNTASAETPFKEPELVDPLADQAAKYPAYWKGLPKHWVAIDTYRVDVLFPLNDSRLTHARKKLLVPGTRTGGKSFRKDILEAYNTLGQWLQDNPEV